MDSRKNALGATMDRRQFVATSAATLVLASSLAPRARAAETLKIGFISPRSGPLGSFGEGDGYVLDQARAALAKGLEVGGVTYGVEILDRDTQSDPARSAQMAKDLINNDHVDLMLASSTPETINPVADACEAAGVPCLSTVMPWEAFYFGRGAKPGQPSPFKWTYHFGFGVDEFARAYQTQWNLIATNKKVGVLYPNDADGNAIRAALAPQLAKAGFTIVDPGAFEDLTVDYSAQIRAFKDAGVEIINSFALPPDFITFWRQAAQQGLTRQIKIAQIAKMGLFPSDIAALGSLGPRMASAVYWHKDMPYSSPVTGISSADLASGYEAKTGRQWMIQLGASLALFDAGVAALKASGNARDKAAVATAISRLKTDTINGVVDFTSGPVPNVAHGPILGSQWLKVEGSKYPFDQVLTENTTDPKVKITGHLVPYNG